MGTAKPTQAAKTTTTRREPARGAGYVRAFNVAATSGATILSRPTRPFSIFATNDESWKTWSAGSADRQGSK